MSFDYSQLEFSRPAEKIKTIDVGPIPKRIFDDMRKYEDASRSFDMRRLGFEWKTDPLLSSPHLIVSHRPEDAQVSQLYKIPADPTSTDIERLTHFDISSGRTIYSFLPILGEDWRGYWRGEGAIMVMDLDGSETFQLWRYWEDSKNTVVLPKIEGELDNSPGKGRIERLTHNDRRHWLTDVSQSGNLLFFSSNLDKEPELMLYSVRLRNSNTGAKADSTPLSIKPRRLTPFSEKGSARWRCESISSNEKYVLAINDLSAVYRPLYLIDISGEEPSAPERIILPGTLESEDAISNTHCIFSKDPTQPGLVYMTTTAYGDFASIVSYDIFTKTVVHITTAEPSIPSIRPVPWFTANYIVSSEFILMKANVEGWGQIFVMPLTGPHKNAVIEVKLQWEGGSISSLASNEKNGRPYEVALGLRSHRSYGYIAHLDLEKALKPENIWQDENGNLFLTTTFDSYKQAATAVPGFRTLPAQLLKFKSFDGLNVPAMYYHPKERNSAVPVVIAIHGGPEIQANSEYRFPIHEYLLNELGCAIIYPNVRGSSGYGKRYLSLDDVTKREDSVKDIGALLDHISANMANELDSKKIAVMGGSYGGYMTFACLTHFSSKLTCGVANFGISHWPSFLENTATVRRDSRRREYGDERDPVIREFMERISPANNAHKISVPLSIAHGENDVRVPVREAFGMWDIVKKNGIPTELIICEKEGHGFKQKSVIEFVNAAKIRFIERYLFPGQYNDA